MTGQNKEKIISSGRDIHKILLSLAKELQSVESQTDDINRRGQLKFCVEWALKNTFESEKGDSWEFSDSSINSNINVMLNPMDATAHWKISPHGLEIRNDNSTFESIRATMGVSSGRWFYEVLLLTNGIMQIGYATKRCMFGPEEGTGVGDDQVRSNIELSIVIHVSPAFNNRMNNLTLCSMDLHSMVAEMFFNSYLNQANGVSMPYGETESWKPGDVVGVYMDIGLGFVRFYLNGKDLGESPLNAEQFRKLAEHGLHPALSFTSYQQAVVNFGAEKFRYPPPSPYQTLNSHGQLSFELRDSIKKRVWRASRYRSMSMSSYWKQQLVDTEEDFDTQCSICFAMPPSIRLNPCNHDGFCVDCAKMMHSWYTS
ncbi:780_t:CDS:2 [Acaulospora colombiana]|uniref:780_t:CDS:1 n=1 Tax=Acaulospora colombiana TaxID=27376 RepID=A0ACA9K088_9GLOM|nr:780_t:CDS:2 [Acaulospora colombiana]